MNHIFVLFALFGAALAGYEQQTVVAQPQPAAYAVAQPAYAQAAYAAPVQAYGPPAQAYAAPAAVAPVLKSSAPQQYSQQIPAAAIRNVENVMVTKTITPVITKVTTHNSHSEPAVSVGHVQGYSTHAHGPAKYAPVQYTTQYTQYINPTVGDNGPVTYAGPAVSQGVAIQEGAVAVGPAYAGHAHAGPAYAGHAHAGLAYAGHAGPAYAGAGLAHGGAIAYQQPQPAFYNAGYQQAYAQPAYLAAGAYQAQGAYLNAGPAYAAAPAAGFLGAYDTGALLNAAGYSGSLGHYAH